MIFLKRYIGVRRIYIQGNRIFYMVEVEFDVDFKVGFRLDLNNLSGRKVFLVGRIVFENIQKC